MRAARRGFCVVVPAVVVLGAGAAELHSLDVSRDRGRYELVAETHLEARPEDIFAVLVDYEDGGFGRISSVYKQSDYLDPAPDGTPIVYTRMEGCILGFCRSMERVERLEADAPHYIRTVALPELSDFEYATSEWSLDPVDDGTAVTYKLVIDPDFWVPPLIGPLILKHQLKAGGERAIYRIERLARGEPTETYRSEGVDEDEIASRMEDAGGADAELARAR